MDTIIVDGACSPYEWHYPVATSDIWILITHGLIDIRDLSHITSAAGGERGFGNADGSWGGLADISKNIGIFLNFPRFPNAVQLQ